MISQHIRREFTMIARLKSLMFAVVCLVGGWLVPALYAEDANYVIAPELPEGFDFDVTVMFGGLLGVLLPAVAAGIGLAAAIWAVGLIWRKVRGVTW
jgi:hypothetical protein